MSVDAAKIRSSALTLRFKYGRSTILLFIEPLTSFPTIKNLLLEALREQYPSGLPSSISPEPLPLPEEISDIILGVPKDKYDASKGYEELNTEGNLRESPKSLNVEDGDVIAFTFLGKGKGKDTDELADGEGLFHVEAPNLDELYPEDEEE